MNQDIFWRWEELVIDWMWGVKGSDIKDDSLDFGRNIWVGGDIIY